MSLHVVPANTPPEAQNIRFDAEASNVVVLYEKENDITKFNAALNTILRRIGRIGAQEFYRVTMERILVTIDSEEYHGKRATF
jgi:tRNA threonylcarbamoyladenosine modification (KEOPS) complex  Pcc1 subunit